MPRLGPLACRLRLGKRTVAGQTGIYTVAIFMRLGGVQKRLGQINRIDMPAANFATQFCQAVAMPLHTGLRVVPNDGSGTAAHGQSREFAHI